MVSVFVGYAEPRVMFLLSAIVVVGSLFLYTQNPYVPK